MSVFLNLLPTILGALPSLIQLIEKAFGGTAPSPQAHADAVANLIVTITQDVAKFVPNSPEAKLAEQIAGDLAASGVKAWYDIKSFLEAQAKAQVAAATK